MAKKKVVVEEATPDFVVKAEERLIALTIVNVVKRHTSCVSIKRSDIKAELGRRGIVGFKKVFDAYDCIIVVVA